ncbi:hypothetical protein G9A89_007309 [Geosiphon pyriformis]|nr:hypothetical protein G9A89_007309 [Geosiphon pyriformis]
MNLGHFSGSNILVSEWFAEIYNSLLEIWSGLFDVYMDDSLKFAGSANVVSSVAVYFSVLDMRIDIGVYGLLFFTMTELQTVALSLECVPSFSSVVLYLDNQTAINACMSEVSCNFPDFHNQYWIERRHISNLIKNKDLFVYWVKVKSHSGIPSNMRANVLTGEVTGSFFMLLAEVHKHFLMAENSVVFGNACYFVRNIFCFICYARWEAGSGYDVILSAMLKNLDWHATAKVWYPDSHMLTGFTSQKTSNLYTYMIKAVHRRLPIAVRKRLYDKSYSGVLCLFCNETKLPDHVFTYACDIFVRNEILLEASTCWISLVGVCDLNSSTVLRTLVHCLSDVGLYSVVYKRFVLKE